MGEFQESVMVALLPTTSDWCRIKLPHMTLIYAGEIPDLNVSLHNTLAKAALEISELYPPMTLQVIGTDVFGDEKLVDVLLIEPSADLLSMQDLFDQWSGSEHPFNPHVTVGPMFSTKDQTPSQLTFDRILVSWGEDKLSYKLRGASEPPNS